MVEGADVGQSQFLLLLDRFALHGERTVKERIVLRVLRHSKAEGTPLLVLRTLIGFADDTGIVRGVSIGEIAKAIRRSEDTARRGLRALRSLHEIELLRRGGGKQRNSYRITLPPKRTTRTA